MSHTLECTFTLQGLTFKTYWHTSQRRLATSELQPRFVPGECDRKGLSPFWSRWSSAKALSEALDSSPFDRFEMVFFTPTVKPDQWYASVSAFVHNNFTTRVFTRQEAREYIDGVVAELLEFSTHDHSKQR